MGLFYHSKKVTKELQEVDLLGENLGILSPYVQAVSKVSGVNQFLTLQLAYIAKNICNFYSLAKESFPASAIGDIDKTVFYYHYSSGVDKDHLQRYALGIAFGTILHTAAPLSTMSKNYDEKKDEYTGNLKKFLTNMESTKQPKDIVNTASIVYDELNKVRVDSRPTMANRLSECIATMLRIDLPEGQVFMPSVTIKLLMVIAHIADDPILSQDDAREALSSIEVL